MPIQPYEKMVNQYLSDIQTVRQTFFDECLKKVHKMDVSKYNQQQVEQLAYKIGQLTFLQFSEAIHHKYEGDKNSNIIEMSLNSQKKIFIGSGPYYLPQQIIKQTGGFLKP